MGNHHNYTFGQLHLNIGHQVRLEQICVDPNGPKFARLHPKGESVWHKQYNNDIDKADMKLYPPLGAEIEAGKRGICVARDLAKSVGMFPERGDAAEGNEDPPDYLPDGGNCPKDLWWFFKPFHYHGNKIGDVHFDDGMMMTVMTMMMIMTCTVMEMNVMLNMSPVVAVVPLKATALLLWKIWRILKF